MKNSLKQQSARPNCTTARHLTVYIMPSDIITLLTLCFFASCFAGVTFLFIVYFKLICTL